MAASDDLFHLIKCLSKSEKRYFRIYADLHGSGEKNYLKLFDAMESLSTHDEALLEKKLAGATFLKELHVVKNYLHRLILKSMRAYNEAKSVNAKLFNLMQDAEFLAQKGLYSQTKKVLTKARKIADQYDKHYIGFEIIRRQISNTIVMNRQGVAEELKAHYREASGLLVLMEKEHTFSEFNNYFYVQFRKERALRDPELMERSEEMFQHPMLSDSIPDTFYSRYHLHNIYAFHHLLKGNLREANGYYAKVVEEWERHPHHIKEQPYLYKIWLSNYLNSCHTTRNYKVFPEVLTKIKGLEPIHFHDEAETFQNVTYLELLYYMNTNQLEKGLSLSPVIEKGMQRYADWINRARKLAFAHNLMVLHLVCEEHKTALYWVNAILSETKHELRKDIQRFARIALLLLHFELENYDLMHDLHRSASRYFKKHGGAYEFENICLALFKKLPSTSRDNKDELLLHFSEQLKLLPRDGQQIQGREEVELWIEKSLKKVPFREVLA